MILAVNAMHGKFGCSRANQTHKILKIIYKYSIILSIKILKLKVKNTVALKKSKKWDCLVYYIHCRAQRRCSDIGYPCMH